MKQLIIVRHAKSSWEAGILNDYDRVLNDRGHDEAKSMAVVLKQKGINPQHLISSTATRAFTTATYFANEFEMPIADIEKQGYLYNAPEENYFEVIKNASDDFNCVAVFGHNPGITYFVNMLTNKQIIEMPTCGVFVVQIDCKSWKDFKKAKKTFLHFLHP
jgi:phosphohistidine phosphatase